MNASANWSQRTEMFLEVFEFILGRKEPRLIFGDRKAIIGVVWVTQIDLSGKKYIRRQVITSKKRDACFLTRSMSMGRASCWRTNVRLSMKPSPLIWLSSTFSEKRDHVEVPIWSFPSLLETNLPSYEYVSCSVERISVDILWSHFVRRHSRRTPRRSCASNIVLDRVDFAPVNEVVSLCIQRNLDCSRE